MGLPQLWQSGPKVNRRLGFHLIVLRFHCSGVALRVGRAATARKAAPRYYERLSMRRLAKAARAACRSSSHRDIRDSVDRLQDGDTANRPITLLETSSDDDVHSPYTSAENVPPQIV